MTQWYVFETRTGRVLREIVPKSGTWQSRLNEAETLDIMLPLTQPTPNQQDMQEAARERAEIIAQAAKQNTAIVGDEPPIPTLIATNLAKNPSFERTSGEVVVRRNLCPAPSFESTKLNAWKSSGLGTGSRFERSQDWADSGGAWSAKVTNTSGTAGDIRSSSGSFTEFAWGMEPGKTYKIEAKIYLPVASAKTGGRRRRILFWYSNNGSDSGGTYNEMFGPQVSGEAGIHTLEHTVTVPADATGCIVAIGCQGDTTGEPFVTYVDSVSVSSEFGYFDGSSAATGDFSYSWAGEEGDSASEERAQGVADGPTLSGAGGLVWSSSDGAHHGSRFTRCVLAGAAATGVILKDISVTADVVYTLKIWARAMTRDTVVRPRIANGWGPEVTLKKGKWQELAVTTSGTNPANNGLLLENARGHRAGDIIDVGEHILVEGDYTGDYFDGSKKPTTTTEYAWAGEPHDSESLALSPRVTGLTWVSPSGHPYQWNGTDWVDLVPDPVERTDDGSGWKNLLTAWKHSIMVDEGGRLYGGPIMPHDYDDGTTLKVTARGIRAWIATRRILPPLALELPLVTSEGDPNDALDTNLEKLDFGSIGRYLVKQANEWPGTGLPIVFEDERPGRRKREYKAVELKSIDDALTQLSGVENGPDFDFQLRWKDESHVEWVMISGTEEEPQLASKDVFSWDLNASDASGASLKVTTDPRSMGSLSWATAGRGDDSVLVAMSYDPYLTDNGVPLMELVDTTHTSVSEQETLDSWSREQLRTSKQPSEFWSFRVSLLRSPWLREYRVGDWCQLTVTGDPYIPDGVYTRRILELSGDEQGLWVDITTGEDYGKGSRS